MTALLVRLLGFLERLFPRLANRIKIDFIVRRERRTRPHPFSLWTGGHQGPPRENLPPDCDPPPPVPGPFEPSGYVSWPGLVDRSYTGRHLPPSETDPAGLPDPQAIYDTVFRRTGPMVECPRTTALFCFFAQWFTDSFLRTGRCDRRRHTGNNEIDYCQIYGLDEATAWVLRTRQGGLLRTRGPAGHERLPFLVLQDGSDAWDPTFDGLPYKHPGYRAAVLGRLAHLPPPEPERWRAMYATGLDRGNSTIFYTALSTLCVREHNRLARALAAQFPAWDDDRLFETARVINIRNVLEIVVEDYINHLAGVGRFKLDDNWAEGRPWYRTNRISLEFNLLYRWHSLVPDAVPLDGQTIGWGQYRFNNALLEGSTPERVLSAAAAAPAGRIGLYNTPDFLDQAEMSSIRLGREFRLRSFNAYREQFSLAPYDSFKALTGGDERAARDLDTLYKGRIEDVDLVVGLFAEGRGKQKDSVLPPLLTTMVAVDAFTHILTNPLLSKQVKSEAFPENLQRYVTNTGGLAGLVKRTAAPGETVNVSFGRAA